MFSRLFNSAKKMAAEECKSIIAACVVATVYENRPSTVINVDKVIKVKDQATQTNER
jgi:hypothetical protein